MRLELRQKWRQSAFQIRKPDFSHALGHIRTTSRDPDRLPSVFSWPNPAARFLGNQMEILIGLTMAIFLPLAIVVTMHLWIGSYPEPYPETLDPRREVIEIALLWLVAMAVFAIFMRALSAEDFQRPLTPPLMLGNFLYMVVPFLILPLTYVVYVQKWTARDLGFRLPRSWPMVAFALTLFSLVGVSPLFEGRSEPLPWSLIGFAVYQPAFIEEFFFRVILQGKLERVLGPHKAWFYSGILFGLFHVPVDFFGPQFYAHGSDYVNALFLLLSQIIAGWIFGIIYAKTRSVLPGMAAHFMTDFRFGSIVLYLTA
jgi:membrane protease YdiL (CAAX protease family)